ncbi:hypothetical protein ABEB36_008977 [Hypothenemus hampei]|uniref:Mitochondrial assembly of ribosomal large subunit protein 1 n=1 Tax=Hypothenemus hampei TaxID=57062 RepID=A0ABD1ENP6_HYPHA
MSLSPRILRSFSKRATRNLGGLYSFQTFKRCLTTDRLNAFEHNRENKPMGSNLEDNQEILDVYKERLKYSPLLENDEEEEQQHRFGNLNLSRGLHGVFDIEDLVETLHHQQAEDIFVANVPKEIKYVDYIVVVSGRSQRHMQAIAQFVRRVFKQKRYSTDTVPILEGAKSSHWMAMDLGNIALHIFSRESRLEYDLDSLWAVGHKYDEEFNKKEPVSSMLENYGISLKELQPAN